MTRMITPELRRAVRSERVVAAALIVFMAMVLGAALWLGGPLLEFLMPRVWD